MGEDGLEQGEELSHGGLSRDSLGEFIDNDLGDEGPASSPQGLDTSPQEAAARRGGPGGLARLHRQQDPIQPGSTPFGEARLIWGVRVIARALCCWQPCCS